MPQLLHLVFGGELTDPQGTEFRDVSAIDLVGIFPDYATAFAAWKAKAQGSVDNAHMRYFIAHLHRLQRRPSAPAARRRSWAERRRRAHGRGRASLACCSGSTSRSPGGRAASRAGCSRAGGATAEEHPERLPERMGEAGPPRPDGPLVWFHAASVGEAASLLEMLRRLQLARRRLTCLVTTVTVTSAEFLAGAAARALHPPVRAGRRAALGPSASSTTGAPTSRSGPRASSGRR